MKRIVALTILLALMAGCTTPFSQFYYDRTGGVDITTLPTVIVSQDEPKKFRGNKQEEDYLQMIENGYMLIGYSSFNAGNVDEHGAIAQAKKVHASVIILYSKYTGTVSGALPLTRPDTQTSTTSFFGNVYGSEGNATYSGSAQTTTYGTRTTYIPYSVRRADYFATYWIKMKPLIFGASVRDLTAEVRQKIKSNKGVLIDAVMKGSPAFHVDVLRGDVIRKIGNIDIYGTESFQKAVTEYAGQNIDVVIMRDGEEIEKEIQLNEKN